MEPIRKPPYQLHKASGQAKVRLNGKDKYLGKDNSPASVELYGRVVAEWMAGKEATAPRQPARVKLTVRELYDRFWRLRVEPYYWKDGKPTGEEGNIRAALARVLELYGSTPAEQFGPLQLKAVRARMIDVGLTRRVINRNLGRVRLMFRWAVSEELYSPEKLTALKAVEPLEANRSLAREKKRVGPVPVDVVRATLPHLGSRIAAMVRLQLLTGMRPGEVCLIRPCDLDRSDPTVWLYRPASHKTEHHGRERVIPFGPQARAVLDPWLLRAPDGYCFQPAETIAAQEGRGVDVVAVAGSRRPKVGTPYSVDSYRRSIGYGCGRAFPPPADLDALALRAWTKAHSWHPNQVRHTAATLIRSHKDLEAAQVVLGHSKPDTTLIYAERDLERAKDLMRAIG